MANKKKKKKPYTEFIFSMSDVERAETKNSNSIEINKLTEIRAKHITKSAEYKKEFKKVSLLKKLGLISAAMIVSSLCIGVPALFGFVVVIFATIIEKQFNFIKRLFHNISERALYQNIKDIERKQNIIETVNERKKEAENKKPTTEEATETQEIKSDEAIKNNTNEAESLVNDLEVKDSSKEAKATEENKVTENHKAKPEFLDAYNESKAMNASKKNAKTNGKDQANDIGKEM